MRQFITILLVISLSWITTGYACQMDNQNLVRALCCCKGKHMVMEDTDVEKSQASSADKKPCCDTTISSSIDQQQPAVASASPVLDLPVVAMLPTMEWSIAAPVASFISLPPPARGPPSSAGTRTYLATARLRL
jgi:hypothetical protein